MYPHSHCIFIINIYDIFFLKGEKEEEKKNTHNFSGAFLKFEYNNQHTLLKGIL